MIQVELPLIGTKEKGMLSAFIYTENSQWKVKYARVSLIVCVLFIWACKRIIYYLLFIIIDFIEVLSQNNTIVKEIIPNTAVIGLEN